MLFRLSQPKKPIVYIGILFILILGLWLPRILGRAFGSIDPKILAVDSSSLPAEKRGALGLDTCTLLKSSLQPSIGLEDFAVLEPLEPLGTRSVVITGGFDRIYHHLPSVIALSKEALTRGQSVEIPIHWTGPSQPLNPHGIESFLFQDGWHVFFIHHDSHVQSDREAESEIREYRVLPGSGQSTLTFEWIKTWRHPSLVAPNSLVVLSDDELLVSLDHGSGKKWLQTLEDYSTIGFGQILWMNRSGGVKSVAQGFAFSNGIEIDRVRKRLYLAEMLNQRIHVFDLARFKVDPLHPGLSKGLEHIASKKIPGYPDNIVLEQNPASGIPELWVAAHHNILRLSKHSKDATIQSFTEVLRLPLSLIDNSDPARDRISLEELKPEARLRFLGGPLSGVSVAQPLGGGYVILGSIYQTGFLLCHE